MKRNLLNALFFCSLLALGACESTKKMFVDKDDVPLKGERISILDLQKDLAPDSALRDSPVALPEPWVNQFWPQGGGYPNHAMGHLSLAGGLKRAWEESIGEGGDRRAPLTAPPVVAEGYVFTLDARGDVAAFDAQTGKRKWAQSVIPRGEDEGGAVGGGLAYASGKLYVTNGYKYLYALNPETGGLAWKAETPAPVRSAPTVAQDRVYVVTLDNRLLVFSAADGSPLWQYAGVSETTHLLGSAAVAADSSIVVLPLSSGEIYGLRPENGRVVWEDNLSAVRHIGALSSISDIRGLPVIDQGVVYAVSYSGRMVALDQVTGRRLWQREIGSAETPWAAGEYVFLVTSDQQLVALARADGGIRWTAQLPHSPKKDQSIVWSGPVLAGGRLLVAGSSGRLLEIDPEDGTVLKDTDIGDAVDIPPVVAADTLFLLSGNGRLTAYR